MFLAAKTKGTPFNGASTVSPASQHDVLVCVRFPPGTPHSGRFPRALVSPVAANVADGASPDHILAGGGEVRSLVVAGRIVTKDLTLLLEHFRTYHMEVFVLIAFVLVVRAAAATVATELGRPVQVRVVWCDR